MTKTDYDGYSGIDGKPKPAPEVDIAGRVGVPVRPLSPDPIPKTDDRSPGYGWRMSDAARRDIDEIERNVIRETKP